MRGGKANTDETKETSKDPAIDVLTQYSNDEGNEMFRNDDGQDDKQKLIYS